jgi:hypothetical protein
MQLIFKSSLNRVRLSAQIGGSLTAGPEKIVADINVLEAGVAIFATNAPVAINLAFQTSADTQAASPEAVAGLEKEVVSHVLVDKPAIAYTSFRDIRLLWAVRIICADIHRQL